MSRIRDFISYLNSHIGDAYVWGAQGQCISCMDDNELDAFLDRREDSASNIARVERYIAGATKDPLYAFDCSGLILYYFQNLKGWLESDTNANGLYGQCKDIRGKLTTSTPLEVGDLLFIDNGSRKTHVGVYVGGGCAIEARGRDYGVVMRQVSYTYWTHYGRHPELLKTDEEPAPEPQAAKVVALTSPMMRGEDIRALQTALNLLGYDCGKADGIAGEKTLAGIQAFGAAHAPEITPQPAPLPDTIDAAVTVGGRTYRGRLEV